MEGRIVMVAYKPKPGKETELRHLAVDHHPRLKEQDLVTDRLPILMRSTDGTIIEVFEWRSAEAIQQAHSNKAAGEMWMQFSEVCDYVSIDKIPESANRFADYSPL